MPEEIHEREYFATRASAHSSEHRINRLYGRRRLGRPLALLVLTLSLASGGHAKAHASETCRKVNILKRFVGIPDTCPVDACETWRSSAVFGPGSWHLEVDFNDFIAAPTPPEGQENALFFGTASDLFVARNGDTLKFVNAVATNANSGLGAGIMHAQSGSGRFEGVSGQLFIRADPGLGRARVTGRLCGLPEDDDLEP